MFPNTDPAVNHKLIAVTYFVELKKSSQKKVFLFFFCQQETPWQKITRANASKDWPLNLKKCPSLRKMLFSGMQMFQN
jgi:hypothetical protein